MIALALTFILFISTVWCLPVFPECQCFNKTVDSKILNCKDRKSLSPLWLGEVGNRSGYYVFVVQWPPAFCLASPSKCNIETMRVWSKDFKIHGLWPNYNSSVIPVQPQGYPECCSYSKYSLIWNQNGEEVMKLVAKNPRILIDLQEHWPDSSGSLFNNSANKFFEYEYNKHGTCAMEYYNRYFAPTVHPGIMYLQQAIKFKQSFPFLRALGISPLELFFKDVSIGNLTTVKRMLQKVLSPVKDFVITCSNTKYIFDIRVCISPFNSVAFNCPNSIIAQNNCKDGQTLYMKAWQYS